MTYHRRKPFLRQYADQAMPLVEAIREHHEALEEARAEGDREAELAALGPLGETFRLLGQLDKAVPHLEAALALARELDRPKPLTSNLIRLATAYQYLNRHEEAVPLFEEAVARAKAMGFLEDFAQQHYGKCLAELGRWEEAIAAFERALALREARGDAGLVASSTEALEEARVRAGRA